MKNFIEDYFNRLKKVLDNVSRDEICKFIEILTIARKNKQQIFIMGNGGSSTTSSHFVCDLNKGTKDNNYPPFKFISLNDNISSLMAYANDFSYEDIFIEQLKNYLNSNDVVIGLSGSGNSKNIIKAIEYANKSGAITVGLTGYNGGKLKQIAKYSVNANIEDMQLSEDMHLILCHLIMQYFNK